MKRYLVTFLPIVPALLIFAWLSDDLNFIQDDAFISYRYVENFLQGHGLVYNIGERIEGFTNFGWVVLLIALGGFGLDYIMLSQLIGFLCGVSVIVVTYLLALRIINDRSQWFAVVAAYLVGTTLSLAYWAPAGLETGSFAFLTLLSLYLFVKRSWMLPAILALAVWSRPEGALIAGLLVVIEAVQDRKFPRYSVLCLLIALVVSLPFVAFKIAYYGSVLPNPFYAKTGFHLELLMSGVEYVLRFFGHYPVYMIGLGFATALCFIDGRRELKTICAFVLTYTAYIVLVGGDVLKVHRFFLPVIGMMAVMVAVGLHHLYGKLSHRTAMLVLCVTSILLLGATYYFPAQFVRQYNQLEIAFTGKMATQARLLRQSDESDFSVAVATIGLFGYELLGHRIIDLVGLTDSTIARHPEEPIAGMETTWKERRHNSRYLLQTAPDYVMFSTGIKPSAPAERALLLYPEFLQSYRAVGWRSPWNRRLTLYAFKKVKDVTGDFLPTYPVAWVQHYKKGLDYYAAREPAKALEEFDKALAVSPRPYYLYLLYNRAYNYILLQQHQKAIPLLNDILKQDSLVFEAHRDLYLFALYQDDTAKAVVHERWLERLIPWDWPEMKGEFQQRVKRMRQSAGR